MKNAKFFAAIGVAAAAGLMLVHTDAALAQSALGITATPTKGGPGVFGSGADHCLR